LQPGLLSQALRGQVRTFSRAVSLSNLLDAPTIADLPPSSTLSSQHQQQQQQQQQPDPTTTAVAAATAAAATSADETEQRKLKKGRTQQWAGKGNVIELLNELLDELEGIEQQIAQQAVEHIHANEVGRPAEPGCWQND
jgi:translation initiation factor eIF-2B subunit beta